MVYLGGVTMCPDAMFFVVIDLWMAEMEVGSASIFAQVLIIMFVMTPVLTNLKIFQLKLIILEACKS